MPTTVAGLNGKIALEGLEQAVKGLTQLTQAFQGAGAGAKQAKQPVDDIVAALAKFGVIKTAVTSLIDLGRQTVQNYSDNERLASSLTALVAKEDIHAGRAQNMTQALAGAAGKSRELLAWTQQLAIDSPFSQEGVAQAFKMAQAYGFVSETANKADVDAKRLTQSLIDFASGTGQSEATMSRIALALGQVQAKGKLAGGEMLQLTEAGLNVRQILADSFGKTTDEIVRMQERGLIPADRAIKAIVESLEKDFGGAAKRQANTWAGLLNSLDDIKSVGLREFFTGTFEAIQPLAVDFVTTLSKPEVLTNIRAWGVELGNLTKSGVQGLQFVVQNVQALTPIIVGAGAAWLGYQVAQNAATFASAAQAVTSLYLTAVEAAETITLTAQTEGRWAATVAAYANIKALGGLALTLGVVAIAAAAATAAYLKWKEVQAQIAQGVQDTAGKTRGWNESADALDRYTKLSPAAQAATGAQAESLRKLREAQEQAIDAYARHKIAGQSRYESSAHYEASLQAERDAINARSTALQQATAAFDNAAHYEDVENNRLQIGIALRRTSAESAQLLIDKVNQLAAVIELSADKSLLDAHAKEAVTAQTNLLNAQVKLAADAYLKLNPNITAAGVASAAANKQISDTVAQYILLTLKINAARGELAQLQAQAGMTPAKAQALAANPGDIGRYITSGATASKDDGEAALKRYQALVGHDKAHADALRNQILSTGTAAEKQALLNKEYADAARIYGTTSTQAITAKTALDSFTASQQKSATTAGNQAAKATQDLLLAQTDGTLNKLQVQHDNLVKHLSALKKNSTDYKETLAEILNLETQIKDAKQQQLVAQISLGLATLDNRKTERSENDRLARAQRIIASGIGSPELQAEARDELARVPLERQKRDIEYANLQRAAGVTPNSTAPSTPVGTSNFAAQNLGPNAPTPANGASTSATMPQQQLGAGKIGPVSIQIIIDGRTIGDVILPYLDERQIVALQAADHAGV